MVKYTEDFREEFKKERRVLQECFHRLGKVLPDLGPNRKQVPRKIN